MLHALIYLNGEGDSLNVLRLCVCVCLTSIARSKNKNVFSFINSLVNK